MSAELTINLRGNRHKNERRVPSIKELDPPERCNRPATIDEALVIPYRCKNIWVDFLSALETVAGDYKALLRAFAGVDIHRLPFLFALYLSRSPFCPNGCLLVHIDNALRRTIRQKMSYSDSLQIIWLKDKHNHNHKHLINRHDLYL